MTPPELLVQREGGRPNGPGWTLRVIPNKFPALRVETQMSRRGVGPYDEAAGARAHEVLIETPEHGKSMAELPAERTPAMLAAFQARMLDRSRDPRLRSLRPCR